jgi:hypothetical protein
MITIHVKLEGDGAWPDLAEKVDSVIHLSNDAPPLQIATLSDGMTSGNPSMALRIDLPDGRVVMMETSVRLFLQAARIIAARYPDALA